MAEELNEEQLATFEEATELVAEMNVLFERHEALVEDYSEIMAYIEKRNWRSAYVHWVVSRDSVEGTGGSDGVSSD